MRHRIAKQQKKNAGWIIDIIVSKINFYFNKKDLQIKLFT
jgi:hypothetical protein